MNRKQHKGIIVVIIMISLLQLIKGLIVDDIEMRYGKSRIELLTNQNETLSSFQKDYLGDHLLIQSSMREYMLKEQKIRVIATSSDYEQMEDIALADGSFWKEEGDQKGYDQIVISDTLARKLWGNAYWIGQVIHIEEIPYQVVGVYKRFHAIEDYLYDDGYERVFMPKSSTLSHKWVTQLMVIDGRYAKKKLSLATLGLKSYGSKETIISNRECWSKELISRSILPLLLMVIVSIYKVAWKGQQLIKCYFERKEVEQKGLVHIIILGIVLIILLVILGSRIYINPSKLPVENIFDMNFYWKQWLNDHQINQCFLYSELSLFEKMRGTALQIIIFINYLQFFLFVKSLKKIKKMTK